MSKGRLSVLIPARNEELLQKTIESVLAAAEGDVEVIAVLDGYWPEPAVKDHPKVVILHYTEPIGQRAAINQAARVSTGDYIMKLDAHCTVGPGFDRILKEDCKPEWTMVPRMYNLDVVTWKPKKNKRTDYMFITGPKCKKPFRAFYFGHYEDLVTPKPQVDKSKVIDETMCCMGPGWFMHKDRFWDQGGCDEAHGGWGQQGVEVSLKAWLSGGALMVNKRTWFAHYFRGGGVPEGFKSGFPYQISGGDVHRARKYSQDLWLNDKWPRATRKLQWLIDKFNPPTWGDEPNPKIKTGPDLDLSIVIPSYKDPVLHKTIQGILDNFETNYEIIPVIDGYKLATPLISHPRVKPIYLSKNVGMREAINTGVRAAKGKYLMRSDEHCMFCGGFDRIILKDIKDNEIVDARRYFLDPIKWETMERKPIDYSKLIIKTTQSGTKKFASVEWRSRTKERWNIPIDENMAFQGSVWIMARSWWDSVIKELQSEGYGTLYQDTIEMQFKTWAAGGKLMLNKNAWYAHRHREFGRTHRYPASKAIPGWNYALLKHYDDYLKVREAWLNWT